MKGQYFMPVHAAAELLGIRSISAKSESVKDAVAKLGAMYASIGTDLLVDGLRGQVTGTVHLQQLGGHIEMPSLEILTVPIIV